MNVLASLSLLPGRGVAWSMLASSGVSALISTLATTYSPGFSFRTVQVHQIQDAGSDAQHRSQTKLRQAAHRITFSKNGCHVDFTRLTVTERALEPARLFPVVALTARIDRLP